MGIGLDPLHSKFVKIRTIRCSNGRSRFGLSGLSLQSKTWSGEDPNPWGLTIKRLQTRVKLSTSENMQRLFGGRESLTPKTTILSSINQEQRTSSYFVLSPVFSAMKRNTNKQTSLQHTNNRQQKFKAFGEDQSTYNTHESKFS